MAVSQTPIAQSHEILVGSAGQPAACGLRLAGTRPADQQTSRPAVTLIPSHHDIMSGTHKTSENCTDLAALARSASCSDLALAKPVRARAIMTGAVGPAGPILALVARCLGTE